jgi:hypothetical protein
MTTTTATSKLDIVHEVIDIIEQCEADSMAMCIPMQVSTLLQDEYNYSKGEALIFLEAVYLIQELELL